MMNRNHDPVAAPRQIPRHQWSYIQRLVIAFVVAPLPPALLGTYLVCGPSQAFSVDVLMIMAGALYAMLLVIGLPGYLLLHERGRHDFGAHLWMGFAAVALPLLVLSLHWCLNVSCQVDELLPTAYLALLGLPMGGGFWLVSRPDLFAPCT